MMMSVSAWSEVYSGRRQELVMIPVEDTQSRVIQRRRELRREDQVDGIDRGHGNFKVLDEKYCFGRLEKLECLRDAEIGLIIAWWRVDCGGGLGG
jgi:hypothetical protein